MQKKKKQKKKKSISIQDISVPLRLHTTDDDVGPDDAVGRKVLRCRADIMIRDNLQTAHPRRGKGPGAGACFSWR